MTEIIDTETPSLTVPPELKRHEFFMQEALNEAKKAYALGEVPIGAVIVANDEILARGHNLSITSHDPTAHAEIVAIRNACQKVENYRLLNVDLYVTLEPCMMCAGSFVHARIKRVIYGAGDSRNGAMTTNIKLNEIESFNHKVEIIPHILHDECRGLLKQFFQERRLNQANKRK